MNPVILSTFFNSVKGMGFDLAYGDNSSLTGPWNEIQNIQDLCINVEKGNKVYIVGKPNIKFLAFFPIIFRPIYGSIQHTREYSKDGHLSKVCVYGKRKEGNTRQVVSLLKNMFDRRICFIPKPLFCFIQK